jgi:hypothetical protein
MTFEAPKMADMNNMNFYFLDLDGFHFSVVTILEKLRYPLDCQNSIDKPVICKSTFVGWKFVGIYQECLRTAIILRATGSVSMGEEIEMGEYE